MILTLALADLALTAIAIALGYRLRSVRIQRERYRRQVVDQFAPLVGECGE